MEEKKDEERNYFVNNENRVNKGGKGDKIGRNEIINVEKDVKVDDGLVKNDRVIGREEVVERRVSHEPEKPIMERRIERKSDDDLLKDRKEKFINFLKNKQIWVLGILIIAVILGVYIRSMPMHDHGGRPGLWDITTNTWTLGPDLDPWLFTRYAKTIVEEGSLPAIDEMRNVPLGFDTTIESRLLPNLIVWTYYLFNFIGFNVNVEFAGVVLPVIMFGLTIISFFLFVREVFVRKTRRSILKANIIALISTFFMIVIPIFLSRTVAGIPEKESAGFFFIFLAFFLFLRGWKSEKLEIAIVFGILAGITTGVMGLIWGGFSYIFISIGLASLIAFILNKVHKKEFIVYGLWVLISFPLIILFSNRYSLESMLTSLASGPAFFVFLIMIIHFLLWNTKISKIRFLRESKIPKTILTFILSLIILSIIISVFIGPSFIIEKLKAVHQMAFRPTTGRWNITVAENRQPYFTEWVGNFGPFIKNIPLLFWLFFAGSIVLFKKALRKIKQKDAWILTGLYTLLLSGLIFSRYSGSSILNGENFISKSFYYLSVILLIGFFIYYYFRYHKEGNSSFERIRFEYLLLLSLFLLTLFSVRGAVRLIMVLGPIAPIFVGFLIVESIERFGKTKDETFKIILGVIVILILLASIFTFWTFYKSIKAQAYSFVPSAYNQQWQKAMEWVRDETPENSVFGHWWDYGYWLQSIGDRATVLDGGNAIGFWNYWMGRYVLTGDNQDDALEFLYNHNTTHFLIDSTDIGKYTAFSSIGSNEDYDRYSWFGTFLLDEKQTQETNNQTLSVYSGGVALDEDLIIEKDGKEILLPRQSAGVGAIIIPKENVENGTRFAQPYIIAVYQGMQHKIFLRYLHIGGRFYDFKEGIEACAYIFPRLDPQGQGLSKNDFGAALFISPRLFRGMLSQIYILEDPLDRFPNFKMAHVESALIIDNLRNQGLNLPEFIYYQGIQGPIKIWEVEYTGEEEVQEKYLDRDSSKYISWKM